MISWEDWEKERDQYVTEAPPVPQVYLNFHLLLTHSKVWADQLALIREDPESGLSFMRTDPIDLERVMERKILALWNKLTPSNSATIVQQLEDLPIALSEERFRNFLTKLIVTLQANRVFIPMYTKTLMRLEERKAWQDASKKLGSIGRTLLPLLEDTLAQYVQPTSLDEWLEKQGPFAYPEDRFESEQRWKRNFHAIAAAVMYGSATGLWAPSVWTKWMQVLLRSEYGLEAIIVLYQSREDPCKEREGWRPALPLLVAWKEKVSPGRLAFLLQNVLEELQEKGPGLAPTQAAASMRPVVRPVRDVGRDVGRDARGAGGRERDRHRGVADRRERW